MRFARMRPRHADWMRRAAAFARASTMEWKRAAPIADTATETGGGEDASLARGARMSEGLLRAEPRVRAGMLGWIVGQILVGAS